MSSGWRIPRKSSSVFLGATVFSAQGLEFSWTTFRPRAGIPQQPGSSLPASWLNSGGDKCSWPGPPNKQISVCVCVEGGGKEPGTQERICKYSWAPKVCYGLSPSTWVSQVLRAPVSLLTRRSYGPPSLSALWREEGQLMKRKRQALGWGVHCNHRSWTSPYDGYQVGPSWGAEREGGRAGARREGPGLPAPPPGSGPPGRQADKGCSLQAQQSIWNQSCCGTSHPPPPAAPVASSL